MITHHTVLDLDAQARRYTDLHTRPARSKREATAAPRGRIAAGVALLQRRLRLGAPRTPADVAGVAPQRDLTPREAEVLHLIAAGRSTREIAATLGISDGTVERHITNLYAKIHVRSRSEATVFAFTHGLAPLPTP